MRRTSRPGSSDRSSSGASARRDSVTGKPFANRVAQGGIQQHDEILAGALERAQTKVAPGVPVAALPSESRTMARSMPYISAKASILLPLA